MSLSSLKAMGGEKDAGKLRKTAGLDFLGDPRGIGPLPAPDVFSLLVLCYVLAYNAIFCLHRKQALPGVSSLPRLMEVLRCLLVSH